MMKKLLLGLLVCVHLALPEQAALGQSGLFPPWTVLGNPSASAALSQSATITQMLDGAFCGTTNAILQRGASVWGCFTLAGGVGLTSGTSGGIPYYSSATAIDSSGLLAATGIMLGGGAGAAPTTSGCTIDSSNSISCSSSTSAQSIQRLTNTTADATSSQIFFSKNRGGGNITTGDVLGAIRFFGFSNSSSNQSASIVGSSTGTITGSNIPSFLRFATSNTAGIQNQTLTFDNLSHLGNVATLVPTASACAGFALATGATDLAGKLTYTSATTCTINFGATYTNAPACVVSPGSAASTHFATTSTTQLAVTFGTAQTAFSWVCIGN